WSGSSTLTLDNAGTFSINGSMTSFSGTFNLGPTGTTRFNGSSATGSALATFDLGQGTAQLNNRGTATSISLGALLGGSNTTLVGGAGGGAAVVYSVGALNTSGTFFGRINNSGNTAGLTKTGSGTLTLTNTSNYTGA